ncbi:hypothetical protein ACFLVH_05520 [Chloroflexota bacterium]
MKEKIEVVWPLAKLTHPQQHLAPRLDTLEEKTICALFNGAVFRFDETWPLIKQALSRKYHDIKFVGWEEFGIFQRNEELALLEALPDKLRQYGCDAVISGRGC